jgi:hypothetical protein
MLIQSPPKAKYTASDLITSLACMKQTSKSETGREKERKNYEKRQKEEKIKVTTALSWDVTEC